MSDSLSWIDDADNKRIRGIVRCSVDVIAAARQDLEEHRCHLDNQLSSDSPEQNNVRSLRLGNSSVEHVKESVATTSGGGLRRQPFHARLPHQDNEEPCAWSGQINRHRKYRNTTVASKRIQHGFSFLLAIWTQRLDYLTNAVIGVLAAALVISLFFRAGPSDQYPVALPLVGSAKKSGDQEVVPLEFDASRQPAQGFNIHSKSFPKPLPAFAEDISRLLFLADPLWASAPGITVFPYTGLPPALPAFPEDIARLIVVTSPTRKPSELRIQ